MSVPPEPTRPTRSSTSTPSFNPAGTSQSSSFSTASATTSFPRKTSMSIMTASSGISRRPVFDFRLFFLSAFLLTVGKGTAADVDGSASIRAFLASGWASEAEGEVGGEWVSSETIV